MSKGQKTKHNRTFRFPFDIDRRYILGAALFFLLLSFKPINSLIFHRLTSKNIKKEVEKEISAQYKDVQKFVKNKKRLNAAIENSLSREQSLQLKNKIWQVDIFEGDSLVFWTNNRIHNHLGTKSKGQIFAFEDKHSVGVLIKEKYSLNGKEYTIAAALPAYFHFEVQNKYFESYFTFSQRNEIRDDFGYSLSKIEDIKGVDEENTISFKGKKLLQIEETGNFLDQTDKNKWHLILAALPFILFGICIHTFYKVSVRKNIPLYFGLVVLTAVLVRVLTYKFGLPDDFSEFELFNPEIFASSSIRSSLGDVFINTALCFWIIVFYYMNVHQKLVKIDKSKYRIPFLILYLLAILAIPYLLVEVSQDLIRSSSLNYDTSNFANMNFQTLIGLMTLVMCFINAIIAVQITNNYLNDYGIKKKLKYLIPLGLGAIWYALHYVQILNTSFLNETLAFFVWISLFFFLSDRKSLKTKFDFSSYRLLYWVIFLSASSAIFINYLVAQKEKENRVDLARNIINFEDRHTEEKLIKLKYLIGQDSVVNTFFKNKNPGKIPALANYISFNYLADLNIDYNTEVVLFDRDKNNLLNSNKNSYKDMDEYLKPEYNIGESDEIYLYDKSGFERYIIPIIPNVEKREYIAGIYLILSALSYEKNYQEVDITSLDENSSKHYKDNYQLGYYQNGRLSKQVGLAKLPYQIPAPILLKNGAFVLNDALFYSEIGMNISSKDGDRQKTIILRKKKNIFYNFITAYAYIFSFIFLVLSLYILGNIIVRSNFKWERFLNLFGLTLRMRIHLAILFVELIAFVITGVITISYYSSKTQENLQLQSNHGSQNISKALYKMDSLTYMIKDIKSGKLGNHFKKLKEISQKSNTNFNLYSLEGNRIASTSPFLFNNGLISEKINPVALNELKNLEGLTSIHEEKVGNLDYFSLYTYVRDEKNKRLAILHIPNLNSREMLREDVSKLIITLINLYAFIFLLSSFIAFIITNRLTKSFSLIVNQFSKINLNKTNKPLSWPYKDEIGLLISEYNRTLRSLENSTVQLQKSEREMAWREMAKQIAHEIKNPLTPMRLSLQMLQNAMKNDAPNVKELSERMTKTLLEQINALTRIANNFSEFAKMSDISAKKESLKEILRAATGIYIDSDELQFLFMLPSKDYLIYADKVKIIRVLTNLIQNAIQAIPEGEIGYITLTVAKHANKMIRISISDNGTGINDESKDKIFEPQFTTKSSGSGLGLAMCKDIIVKTGGTMEFETIVGEGTTFHVDIPEYQGQDVVKPGEVFDEYALLKDIYDVEDDDMDLDLDDDEFKDVIFDEEEEDDDDDE